MKDLVRIAVCFCLATGTAAAQSALRPSGKASESGLIECLVIDRYGIPVPGVRLSGVSTHYGAFARLAEAPCLTKEISGSVTGADGYSKINAEPDERVWISATKEGYAPLAADGLFSGWKYELTLDLGCGAQLEFIGLTVEDLPIRTEL